MIAPLFKAWERRLASVDTDRVVRPFEWGLDWLGLPESDAPLDSIRAWAAAALADSPAFFHADALDAYDRQDDVIRFASAMTTPYPGANTVVARVLHTRNRKSGARARRGSPMESQRDGRVALPLLRGSA